MDNKFASLPICLVLSILSFSDVYYKEGDLKNRKGKFFQQISEKLTHVIKTKSYRSSRFIPFYYYERFLGDFWRLVVSEDTENDCIKIEFKKLSHLTCYGPSGKYYLH